LGDFDLQVLRSAPVYVLWAAVQQYLLQNFLRKRAVDLLTGSGSGSAVSAPISVVASALAATLFALYHAPNWPLVGVTLGMGFVLCLLFTKTPNFFWAWWSHALLGLTVALFFKWSILDQFQVGPAGHRYDYYGDGVLVAAGYDDDGRPTVVTLPGPEDERRSTVRVFSPVGTLQHQWEAFPEFGFSGHLAVGDLGFGEGDEIVVVPGPGPQNPPTVRVFSMEGRALSEFTPEGPPERYGAWVSVNCGRIYLTAGAGPLSPQEVWEFDGQGTRLRNWKLEGTNLKNGVRAIGLCGPQEGTGSPEPDRLLFWGSEISVNPSHLHVLDLVTQLSRRYETLPTTFGAQVTLVALEAGRQGIAVAPGPLAGYPPWVRVFDASELSQMLFELAPYESDGACGANLAAVDADGDGRDELIMGEGVGPGRPATVRVVQVSGQVVSTFEAY
jgi:hypothetical protein